MTQTRLVNYYNLIKRGSETFSCWTPTCNDYCLRIISSDPRAKITFLRVKSRAGKIHLTAPAVKGISAKLT